jgi:hypothetical protein
MISLRRDAKETALCGAVILAVWYAAQLGGFASAIIQTTAAVPVQEPRAALLAAAGTERGAIPQTTAVIPAVVDAPIVSAEVTDVAEPEIKTATDTAPVTDTATAPDATIVMASLPDPSSIPEPEVPLVEVAIANPSDTAPDDVKPAATAIEILDECLDADVCIDRFLWALYQRTPKQDTVKIHERRKVTVKRKGKMVTVTRNFTKPVDQDFTWKDPDAAERAGLSMMDYVIGGMDRGFKTKLFHALYAAEQAGLSPGITSAFRDDYRQSIASGLKAATGRSFHGGSTRGGYGHGLAADIVSVEGATRAQRWVSTEKFWKWIDANGKEFGIGRPYLGKDPPHVGPIDGSEYASRRGMRVRQAMAQIKKRSKLAVRSGAKAPTKPNTVQAASPARAIKQGAISNRPKMAMAEPGRG